ncbi:MAG: acyl-CoA desaturase [Myxococcota bacterium]
MNTTTITTTAAANTAAAVAAVDPAVTSGAATSHGLTAEEVEAFGAELDAIRQRTLDDLGERDLAHIHQMIRTARYSEALGRLLLHVGRGPVSFAVGTAALALSKVLENMEIGHNIMHGQYNWTGDPELQGQTYEWDNVCAGDNWRHFHNYEHHTYTNILGKDRDIGYTAIRVSSDQPWSPGHLVQPVGALVLAALFQWGVAVHDLRIEDLAEGTCTPEELFERSKPFLRKAAWQLGKDYLVFPALALHRAPRVFAGNLLANLVRNVWSFSVIFCGHFPEGVHMYHPEETEEETRGAWYLRQLNGSANFEGSRLMHILSGHLSHQIEHHLYPDIPAHRYPELAVEVREVCTRYGQSYNTGSLRTQIVSVARNILRYALPNRA